MLQIALRYVVTVGAISAMEAESAVLDVPPIRADRTLRTPAMVCSLVAPIRALVS